MLKILCVILMFVGIIHASDVIANDTNGVIVEVKEKYGGILLDTCTVVIVNGDCFVLVHRNRPASYFPVSFHSIRCWYLKDNQNKEIQ